MIYSSDDVDIVLFTELMRKQNAKLNCDSGVWFYDSIDNMLKFRYHKTGTVEESYTQSLTELYTYRFRLGHLLLYVCEDAYMTSCSVRYV